MDWIEIKSLLKVGSKLFGNNKVYLVIDEFDAIFSFKKEIITEILSEFRSWKTSALIAIKVNNFKIAYTYTTPHLLILLQKVYYCSRNICNFRT